jgi:O-antigen/teichoic acid export membrane protein
LTLIEYSLRRAFTYSLFLAIPVIAGGILLSEKLLYFLYGAAFTSGSPVLVILLFAQIGNIFMFLLTMCLNAMDMPRKTFYCTVFSAALNIVLNILLIPLFGIAGAAVATLVTMSVNAVLAYALLKSFIHIRIERGAVTHLVVSAFIMAGFLSVYLYVLPVRDFIGLAVVLALGAVIYFASVLLIDRTIRNDLKALLETMRIPGMP